MSLLIGPVISLLGIALIFYICSTFGYFKSYSSSALETEVETKRFREYMEELDVDKDSADYVLRKCKSVEDIKRHNKELEKLLRKEVKTK